MIAQPLFEEKAPDLNDCFVSLSEFYRERDADDGIVYLSYDYQEIVVIKFIREFLNNIVLVHSFSFTKEISITFNSRTVD